VTAILLIGMAVSKQFGSFETKYSLE